MPTQRVNSGYRPRTPLLDLEETVFTSSQTRSGNSMVKGFGNGSLVQASPLRASPRKSSSTYSSSTRLNLLPTPLSLSPTTSTYHPTRYPPHFESIPRYTSSQHTPYSPYRPGEYGRSERGGITSERTKIERRLFEDEVKDELVVPARKEEQQRGSSPLAPPFEAKMVLRNGASVDLISWLRTNFHHIPPPHTVLTPTISLIGIRALLLERFPRVPEAEELAKTVLAAFPHSHWDYPTGAFSGAEPPTIRGLVWHGKEPEDEDREEKKDRAEKPTHIITRARASLVKGKVTTGSTSPTQSTLVSPISSSNRRPPPDTPARSVLEEFAEIATLAEKTPGSKTRSLPGEVIAPAPAYALANICNSFDDPMAERGVSRKRRASEIVRATTPDKLHGLLAAAEAVEGSPITSVLGHKRRRTIGGAGSAREYIKPPRRALSHRGTTSPIYRRQTLLDRVTEDTHVDILVPLNDTLSSPLMDQDPDLLSQRIDLHASSSSSLMNNNPAHSASDSSLLLFSNPNVPTSTRKPNELPTEGENPGFDCKPPHPYHELIRTAIESSIEGRLQLSQIYASIAERFPFFKTLDEKKTAGWQNSIRHNLSLKKMFVRVNKIDGIPDDTGGKGGWWTVQPGVPDEGRPGRKSKGKRKGSIGGRDDESHSQSAEIEAEGSGDWGGGMEGALGLGLGLGVGVGGGLDMSVSGEQSAREGSQMGSGLGVGVGVGVSVGVLAGVGVERGVGT